LSLQAWLARRPAGCQEASGLGFVLSTKITICPFGKRSILIFGCSQPLSNVNLISLFTENNWCLHAADNLPTVYAECIKKRRQSRWGKLIARLLHAYYTPSVQVICSI
jgi:hypothetical protein